MLPEKYSYSASVSLHLLHKVNSTVSNMGVFVRSMGITNDGVKRILPTAEY